MAGFADQVKGFHEDVLTLILAIFQTSAQYLAEDIVDHTPVDSGFLRNSFMVSLNELPSIGQEPVGAQSNAITIGAAKLTDKIYLSFTATYAMRVEYGFDGQDSLGRFYNQSGRFMVRGAAQNWNNHVEKAFKDAGGSP